MKSSTFIFTEENIKVQAGNTFDSATYTPLNSGFEQCVDTVFSAAIGEVLYIHCKTTLFYRYVVVYIATDSQMVLTICELEVYQEQGRS